MAAVTSLAAIGLAVGAGSTALQYIQGAQQQNEANKAAQRSLNQLKAIQYENKLKDLQTPTKGVNLARENIAQRTSTALQNLQGLGAAATLGGLPTLTESARKQDLDLAAYIDQLEYENKLRIAGEESRIQDANLGLKANILNQETIGAQQASAEGRATQRAALSSLASSAGGILSSLIGADPEVLNALGIGLNKSSESKDRTIFTPLEQLPSKSVTLAPKPKITINPPSLSTK